MSEGQLTMDVLFHPRPSSSRVSVRPPAAPWLKIDRPSGAGYLSIYYSDDLSPLPIRWITKPGDNKSDPNIETLTYGLFSTCSRGMRSGAVKNAAEFLFFACNRGAGRVLSGYYRLKWYAESGFEAG